MLPWKLPLLAAGVPRLRRSVDAKMVQQRTPDEHMAPSFLSLLRSILSDSQAVAADGDDSPDRAKIPFSQKGAASDLR